VKRYVNVKHFFVFNVIVRKQTIYIRKHIKMEIVASLRNASKDYNKNHFFLFLTTLSDANFPVNIEIGNPVGL
jgi:hypothetical protein